MSAADLVRLQGGGATLAVEPLVEGEDSLGGTTAGWGAAGPELPCWVQSVSSNLREQYQQRQLSVTNKIFLAESPGTIQEGWRVRVTWPTGVVRYFLVRGDTDQAGLGRVWRLDVEEVRG